MARDLKALVGKLTLEEKASLCSGARCVAHQAYRAIGDPIDHDDRRPARTA